MRHGLLLGMAMVLSLSLLAFGSQSVENADSVIIGNATFMPGQNSVSVPVYFVTHGEVTHYNLPLKIDSNGDIRFFGKAISEPLQNWDDNWQGISSNGTEASEMGFADLGGDDNAALNTSGRRVEVFSLDLALNAALPAQDAVISARIDSRSGGPIFGYSDGVTGVTPVVVNGTITLGSAASVEPPLPIEVSLSQNYPNPFNPSTEISYALPEAREIKLTVFNVLGQEVRKLETGVQEAGYHKVTWDGTSNAGAAVPSGTYFYKLDAGDYSKSMKMVLLK